MPTAPLRAQLEATAPASPSATLPEPSPVSPLEKASRTLQTSLHVLRQKAHCLINYAACTKRDRLAISMVFGFIMGYGIKYKPLMTRLLKGAGIKAKIKLTTLPLGNILLNIYLTELAYSIAATVGLTGPLIMSQSTGALGTFFHKYMIAKNKTEYLNKEKGKLAQYSAFSKILFVLIIASEAISVLQEARYAVTYEKKSPVVSLARYIRMNLQCIWSEQYCQPQQNAEQRRLGLYFWLGYLKGTGVRQIQNKFF